MIRAITQVMKEKEFSGPEETQAFLDQFVGGKMSDITASLIGKKNELSAEERADNLFFEAMEAPAAIACRRKLKEALRLNPNHVRAMVALARMEKTAEAEECGYRNAIAAGERNLGDMLRQAGGHLWGFHEARPYLEARAALAEFLTAEGRLEESIEEHRAILALNENDNQGIRDPLLSLLLRTHRFADARVLVKKFDTDYSAVWLYAKAMLEFQRCAELAKWDTAHFDHSWLKRQVEAVARGIKPEIPKAIRAADKTLIKALKFNPFGAIFLFKPSVDIHEDLPDFYSPGSVEEARLFFHFHVSAWIENPAALLWLMVTAMPWLIKNGFSDELKQ